MTPQAKIAALRVALERATQEAVADDMDDWFKTARAVLAMTADNAEQEPVGYTCIDTPRYLRDALDEGQPTSMRVYNKIDADRNITLALYTAPAPIAAEPAPKPWQDCMSESGRRECESLAIELMQQEIDDWRARDMKR